MRIITGAFGGRTIKTTQDGGTRPAMAKTREALFSMLEARGIDWRTTRVLDLYAGSGSLGLEAVSRGAISADFVENGMSACQCIGENISKFALEGQCGLIRTDVARFLRTRKTGPYNLIFLDPPYRKNHADPDLAALAQNGWLAENAFVTAELEKDFQPQPPLCLKPLACRQFGQTCIHIWMAQ